jgi:hypothetical protein
VSNLRLFWFGDAALLRGGAVLGAAQLHRSLAPCGCCSEMRLLGDTPPSSVFASRVSSSSLMPGFATRAAKARVGENRDCGGKRISPGWPRCPRWQSRERTKKKA